MILEIDKETMDFMCKRKLTFNQFCICLLLHNKQYAMMEQYTHQIGYLTGGSFIDPNKRTINELDDLLRKGYIQHDLRDKNNYESLDNFTVTDKFLKGFADVYAKAAKEFWDTYPNNFLINNDASPTAKVMDYKEFEHDYKTIIGKDMSIHIVMMQHIQALTKSNNGFAKMKIKNYLVSKQWENSNNVEQARRTASY